MCADSPVKNLFDAAPGGLYQRDDGSLYVVVGVCHEPTVTLRRLSNENMHPVIPLEMTQETHAVGCLNADAFTKVGSYILRSGEETDA